MFLSGSEFIGGFRKMGEGRSFVFLLEFKVNFRHLENSVCNVSFAVLKIPQFCNILKVSFDP